MKIIKYLKLLILLSSVAGPFATAKIEVVLGSALSKNFNLSGTIPSLGSEEEIILSRDEFVISYNKVRRSPNWVAWKLDSSNFGTAPRVNAFNHDAELEQYLKSQGKDYQVVEPSEYDQMCFDRGHQSPSADHSNSPAANKATFVMSNMVPQTAFLNRVIWEHLEQHTRQLVLNEHKKAYIIAGPIYDEDFGAIGPRKDIPVPSKNFKVIVILEANQTWKDIGPQTEIIAVIMPNVDLDGSKPVVGGPCKPFNISKEDTSDWKSYVSTVPEIQRLSGLAIFSQLP